MTFWKLRVEIKPTEGNIADSPSKDLCLILSLGEHASFDFMFFENTSTQFMHVEHIKTHFN